MANYDVEGYITSVGTPEEVVALMVTEIETVVSGSGIHLAQLIPVGDGSKVVGCLIHATT